MKKSLHPLHPLCLLKTPLPGPFKKAKAAYLTRLPPGTKRHLQEKTNLPAKFEKSLKTLENAGENIGEILRETLEETLRETLGETLGETLRETLGETLEETLRETLRKTGQQNNDKL